MSIWETANEIEGHDIKGQDELQKSINQECVKRNLKIQLEEVEMLQSIFCNPGELKNIDHSIIADINLFLEGNCNLHPSQIDFLIYLDIDDKKFEVCVHLPLNYPEVEPDIFVRNDTLSRSQQHLLNNDLCEYIASFNKGEICIYPAITWLQENGCHYLTSIVNDNCKQQDSKSTESNEHFSRYWIYSHHIYNNNKRKYIIEYAQECNVTGFCLPGKPGIICLEGLESNCSDWWQRECIPKPIKIYLI